METILININLSCVFFIITYTIMINVKYMESKMPSSKRLHCISPVIPSNFLFFFFSMHHITLNLHVFKNNIVVLFFPRIAVLWLCGCTCCSQLELFSQHTTGYGSGCLLGHCVLISASYSTAGTLCYFVDSFQGLPLIFTLHCPPPRLLLLL